MSKIKKIRNKVDKTSKKIKKKQTKILKKNKKLLKNQTKQLKDFHKQLKSGKSEEQESLLKQTPIPKKPKQPKKLKKVLSKSKSLLKPTIKHERIPGSNPEVSLKQKLNKSASIVKKHVEAVKGKAQKQIKNLGVRAESIKIKKNKRKKHKNAEVMEQVSEMKNGKDKFVDKLSQMLNKQAGSSEKTKGVLSLRDRMWQKLKSARFRYLNEEMYTKTGQDSKKLFQADPEAFKTYHEGYKQQVSHWPINPLDVIIKSIKSMPNDFTVADFGCGEAQLALSVKNKVHSFDLVALNPRVTVCDMSKTPLPNESVDVVVFCLSLMGTNLQDYLIEANRVLKVGGILKISEVESRFEKVEDFVTSTERFGFKNVFKDLSHALFYFFDFTKERSLKNKKKLPNITLNPCLYKKR